MEPGLQAPLVDVRGLPIKELFGGDGKLDAVVRRLVQDLDDDDGALSAFSSFAS
jgi:hypothetical protein